jgi:hypothetical protein
MPALAAHVKCALEGNLSCSVGINIVPLIMTVLIWYAEPTLFSISLRIEPLLC